MKISRLKLSEAIGIRTITEFDPQLLAKEIAAYLLSEGRIDELDSLIRDIIEFRASRGILEVSVDSAHDLNNELKDEVMRLAKSYRPDSKKIIVTEQTDKSLIGGIKLSLANQQLDLSIRAKLNQFKQLTNAGKA
jgi:F0F1-type ATP synthase delta subunit